MIEALEVCGKIEGIGVIHFGEKDVVRHNLVQQIIRAYEEYDGTQPQRSGSIERQARVAPERAREIRKRKIFTEPDETSIFN